MNILDMSKNEETLRSTLIHLYSKRRNAEWYPKIAHFLSTRSLLCQTSQIQTLGEKCEKVYK